MGRIIVTTNVSLDGIAEDPDGREGSAVGGWIDRSMGDDRAAWAEFFMAEAMRTDALLLGRRSAEWFGARWASRTGPWADRLNALPKHVVTSSPAALPWTNSVAIRGELRAGVLELRRTIAGEIAIYASYRLVRSLLELALIDELRLVVFPVVLGAGLRLFGEGIASASPRLARAGRLGEGLALLEYRFDARGPAAGGP